MRQEWELYQKRDVKNFQKLIKDIKVQILKAKKKNKNPKKDKYKENYT
jgi:hypothetical protein